MKYKKGTSRTIALVLVSCLCFFIVHRSPVIAPGILERAASCIAYPFLQVQLYVVDPLNQVITKWSHLNSLEKEFEAIVMERDGLQAELVAARATQTFASETEEIRAFAKQYDMHNARLVRVLLKYFGKEGHFFIVEGGERKGIHKDTAVVFKNCLIGKVAEVSPFTSKVVLITDPSCKVASYCDQTKTQGIYEGTFSLTEGSLKHVGHLSTVCEGDMLFSSGEGLVFPKGFGIGTITSFQKNEGDMQYTIAIKLLADVMTIEYCYILEKEQSE